MTFLYNHKLHISYINKTPTKEQQNNDLIVNLLIR